MKQIEEGMIVRYAPEWCDEDERRCLMVVMESYPDVRRCMIKHINSNLFIPLFETVTWDMIKPVGCNVKDVLNAERN